MRSRSPYATRPLPPACRAPGFRYAHLHAAHAHAVHLTDSSDATRYAATHPFDREVCCYAPVLKLLPLILLRCLAQVVMLQLLVIQIVAIKTLVLQMIAATLLRTQTVMIIFCPYSQGPPLDPWPENGHT